MARDAARDIPHQDTISSQLIIAMVRDQKLSPCYQVKNAVKDLARQEICTLACSQAYDMRLKAPDPGPRAGRSINLRSSIGTAPTG